MFPLGLQLCRDERGFIVSSELVLISSLCVIGLVTGLSCLRDAVNGELGDVAKAIGSLNQSHHYTGFHSCESPKCGVHAWTRGSAFSDQVDEQAAAVELDAGVAPAVVPAVTPAPAPVAAPVLPAPQPAAAVVCPPEVPALGAPFPSMTVVSGPVLSTACPCDAAVPAPACGCHTTCDVSPAIPCPLPVPCRPAPCGSLQPGGSQILVW